jgi:MFS family permease
MAVTPGVTARGRRAAPGVTKAEFRVVLGASLGTMFEWYDFYLYGALAPTIAKQFFIGDPATVFVFTLLAFAAGFLVRPFGGLVFGRLADRLGRKTIFLTTIMLMGGATFLVGLLPGYASMGIAAPAALITLRIVQGLAMGGEYAGAATYVAEHAPPGRRGFFTGWFQTTATLGLLLALLVLTGARAAMDAAAFDTWGWRIPFLVSVLLVALSVWVRLSLTESPAFVRLRAAGRTSGAPLREAFGVWRHARTGLLALAGIVMGQAVVWYTSQFYSLTFLTRTLRIEPATANLLLAVALALATPFFVVFGALSDRIGRKKIILAGCLLAGLTYYPIFKGLTHYGNPALEAALAASPVVVAADPSSCRFQFNATETRKFPSSCDIATGVLAAASVSYTRVDAPQGSVAAVRIGERSYAAFDAAMTADGLDFDAASKAQEAAFRKRMAAALKAAGYPAKADPDRVDGPMLVLLLFVLVLYVAMVYGPVAAMLAEMFPTRIRTTALSLPYHIGNGWFGGLLPATAFALVAANGDIYYGLWYPVAIALATVAVGSLFVAETRGRDADAEDADNAAH